MSGEKIMLCLDEAIEKRIDMLMMFQYLSEQNDGVVTDERIQNYGGKYIENACVPARYPFHSHKIT